MDAKYGPLSAEPLAAVESEAASVALRMLEPTYDTAWDRYQNNRYPGTQEIIGTRRNLCADIEAYVAPNTPNARLFELLDPGIADETDPGRRLDSYERVCVEHFDFRKGPNGEIRERQDVTDLTNRTREEMGEELWDATFAACDAEGMVSDSELPDGDHIKCIGILGGTEAAVGNRTRYAMEQLQQHGATARSFDFLVSEGEMGFAFKEAARIGADINPQAELARQERPDGTVITFSSIDINGRQVPVRVLVAKATGGRSRATTLDSMKLWKDVANVQPGDRMVAVTTGLYTAFQNANAKEVITWENSAVIDVIGHSADWAGGKRVAGQLQQEKKAAVDSRYRLYQKMIATGIAPPIPKKH